MNLYNYYSSLVSFPLINPDFVMLQSNTGGVVSGSFYLSGRVNTISMSSRKSKYLTMFLSFGSSQQTSKAFRILSSRVSFMVWKITPTNLFFVTNPFLNGSKSWRYSLYLTLFTLVSLLNSSSMPLTVSGICLGCPVPCFHYSLVWFKQSKFQGLVSFKKSIYLTQPSQVPYTLLSTPNSSSDSSKQLVARTCLNCLGEILFLCNLSQSWKNCLISNLLLLANSLNLYFAYSANRYSSYVGSYFPYLYWVDAG